MNDLSVLYYSASRENPLFEAKIRENILKNKGNLPLVSVTQLPLADFGINICVGQHEPCYSNEFRQIQIGLKRITTKYVIVAESDVLYPPEYFQFQPTYGDYWRYGNVWVNYAHEQKDEPQFIIFKKWSDGAQIQRREFWLDLITKGIGDNDTWFTKNDNKNAVGRLETFPEFTWTSENPVITFKTPNNISRKTSTKQRERENRYSAPYWGDINNLKKSLCI